MKVVPKISIVVSVIALILDIIFIIFGTNTLGSTGIVGTDFLKYGLTFTHGAIVLGLVSVVYSKIKKIEIEYSGFSVVLSVIVLAAPALLVFLSSVING